MSVNGLRPYPAYKDSGVEWLGKVPEHWEAVPLKRIGWFRSGAGFPIREQGRSRGEILFAKVSDMNRSGNRREIATTANSVTREFARELGAHVFPPNTIVFLKVGGALLTNKRRILVRETCIDNNLMGCVVTRAETEFVFRLLRKLDLGRMAKPGPVPAISEGEVREIRIPLPPFPEQRAIARFLKAADRGIRRYIRTKERLIELLEERKRALIHEAVTGRIDVRTGQPYPAYKDSGIEWLGKVPEHWEVRRLKTLSHMQSGEAITAMSINPTGDYRVFGGNGLCGYTSDYTHDGEFVLIGRQGALCGNIHLARGRFWASEHAVVAALSPAHVLEWFRSLLEVMDLNQYSIAAAQPGLSVDRVMNLWAPVPPADEQVLMSKGLVEQSREMGDALVAAKRQIALLREYRTRLIADVVTGKLDVREAAARLPETAPLAGDGDRADTIDTESNLHSTEGHMAKEAMP